MLSKHFIFLKYFFQELPLLEKLEYKFNLIFIQFWVKLRKGAIVASKASKFFKWMTLNQSGGFDCQETFWKAIFPSEFENNFWTVLVIILAMRASNIDNICNLDNLNIKTWHIDQYNLNQTPIVVTFDEKKTYCNVFN